MEMRRSQLENALGMTLPIEVSKRIEGEPFEISSLGKSGSSVIIFPNLVLKISSFSYDRENELRVNRILKDKLPIPKILFHIKKGNRIYLLEERIKGIPLSDDYYMSRPCLLYSLAKEALRMLHQVDVKGLGLASTDDLILDFGWKACREGRLDFAKADKSATEGFDCFEDALSFLEKSRPKGEDVLCHGDLCLPNILVEGDRISGFVDLGLMGVSNSYHDLAILYRSVRNNFSGVYGKSYPGYQEDWLTGFIDFEEGRELIRYYLLLDEVLG